MAPCKRINFSNCSKGLGMEKKIVKNILSSCLASVSHVRTIAPSIKITLNSFIFLVWLVLVIDWGDTPTSQFVLGVLTWRGLFSYVHNSFPNLEKNFFYRGNHYPGYHTQRFTR